MVLDDFIKAVSTKAGVYQFYVYPLGKYYIGESVNIRRRVKEHLTKGGNIDIACMIEMYGLDCIGFQILKFEDDRQKRLELENYYKNFYGRSKLLNKVEGIESITPNTSKRIVIYDLMGSHVGTWNNSVEASKALNVSVGSLRLSASGNRKTGQGYICFYEGQTDNIEQKLKERLQFVLNRQKYLVELATKNYESCKKPVLAKRSDEEFVFMSGREAAYYFNIKPANISACCLGKLKIYKNFEWSYVNE